MLVENVVVGMNVRSSKKIEIPHLVGKRLPEGMRFKVFAGKVLKVMPRTKMVEVEYWVPMGNAKEKCRIPFGTEIELLPDNVSVYDGGYYKKPLDF